MAQSLGGAAGPDLGELRAELLARVDGVRQLLQDTAEASEAACMLVPAAVSALHDAGLLRLNVPRELGGWEAAPAIQTEVLAALAEIDAAAGWSTMVSNNSAGFMGAYLSDAGVQEVFADGEVPICAGVAAPSGEAVRVDGGFRVSGYWRLCSGVHQAAWLRLTALIDGDPSRSVVVIVPQASVKIHDTWHVLGLRGTGSNDVSLDNEFVPDHRTVLREERQRGGGQYRLTGLRSASYEHVGIAVGLARRAVNELADVVKQKAEARGASPRDVVTTALGRLSIECDSIAALAIVTYERAFEAVQDDDADVSEVGAEGPAVAAYTTETALQCIETAYRYAGTVGLYQPNVFERLLRDIHGALQHVMVQDDHYTQLGASLVALSRS